MKRAVITLVASLILTACGAGTEELAQTPTPQQSARTASTVVQGASAAPAPGMEISANGITIRTCDHDANAICSLVQNGQQYIDDHDHGRQLQSAVSYDNLGEGFNPTEAGASFWTDGINPHPSSSMPIAAQVIQNQFFTTTQMAYWNPVKGVKLSNNRVAKQVKIGLPGLPNVIDYRVTFTRPAEETHTWGQYEALTGYMPSSFSVFYKFNVKGGATAPEALSDGPGEQAWPVILCKPNGTHCMGIYSPQLPQPAYADQAGYGRWRFTSENVVKWNAVFRGASPAAYQSFQLYVIVGTLDQVTTQMRSLHQQVGI